jgi:hypothetical protein
MSSRTKKRNGGSESERRPNRALIITDSLEAIKHWIRVFQLEGELAFGIARFNEICESPEGKAQGAGAESRLMMPIINEFRVDQHLSYVYLISIQIDTIGLVNGGAIIYVCEDSNKEEALEYRDRHATYVMEETRKKGIWKETYIAPERKEPLA